MPGSTSTSPLVFRLAPRPITLVLARLLLDAGRLQRWSSNASAVGTSHLSYLRYVLRTAAEAALTPQNCPPSSHQQDPSQTSPRPPSAPQNLPCLRCPIVSIRQRHVYAATAHTWYRVQPSAHACRLAGAGSEGCYSLSFLDSEMGLIHVRIRAKCAFQRIRRSKQGEASLSDAPGCTGRECHRHHPSR